MGPLNMCLQCETKARTIVKEVLPGYSLMKSMVDHPDWPIGHYGLVRSDDPDFVWEGKPLIDPLFRMTRAQIKKVLGKDRDRFGKILTDYKGFCALASSMEKKFAVDPYIGYLLVKGCFKVGFRESDGRFMFWLCHHMATRMKRKR